MGGLKTNRVLTLVCIIIASCVNSASTCKEIVEQGLALCNNENDESVDYLQFGSWETVTNWTESLGNSECLSQYVKNVVVGVSYEGRLMKGIWVSHPSVVEDPPSTSFDRIQLMFLESIVSEETALLQKQSDGQPNTDRRIQTLSTVNEMLQTYKDKNPPELLPHQSSSRNTMLVTALHHSREPASLNVLLYFLTHALAAHTSNNGSMGLATPPDVDLEAMVRESDLFFLPFVNPDGYVAIRELENPNIRKNRRPTCSNPAIAYDEMKNRAVPRRASERYREYSLARGGPQRRRFAGLRSKVSESISNDGVDINRNYDDHWESTHPRCDQQEYEGLHAFSEPETRTMRRLASIIPNVVVALNFHAYGDIWTHPYNCCVRKELSKDAALFFDELRSVLNVSYFGSAPNSAILGYPAFGEADDYLLSHYDIYSMSPEVGPEESGFFPNRECVRLTNKQTFERVKSVYSKVGSELRTATKRTADNTFVFALVNTGLGNAGRGVLTIDVGLAPLLGERGNQSQSTLIVPNMMDEQQKAILSSFEPLKCSAPATGCAAASVNLGGPVQFPLTYSMELPAARHYVLMNMSVQGVPDNESDLSLRICITGTGRGRRCGIVPYHVGESSIPLVNVNQTDVVADVPSSEILETTGYSKFRIGASDDHHHHMVPPIVPVEEIARLPTGHVNYASHTIIVLFTVIIGLSLTMALSVILYKYVWQLAFNNSRMYTELP